MSDKKLKPVEGEIVETSPVGARPPREDSPRGGVFIGTLNIMTEPARNFITEPLLGVYRSRYHGKFKRPKHVFAFDLFLVAVGATLATAAIYFGLIFKPFDPVQIQLATGPKNPMSGSEVVISLNVSNMNDTAMKNASATFKLPEEIKIIRSSPRFYNSENRVTLGTIESQGEARERLVGRLYGAVGKNIKVTSVISYTDAKTGEERSRGATASFTIASSSIGAEFELPEKIITGQTFNASVRYFNRSNDIAKNILITPQWPSGFTLSSSEQPLKNGRWEAGTLAPGSENKIDFSGVIISTGAEADFALLMNGSQSLKTVVITDPQIKITMSGTNKARLGDTIDLTASYKNEGDHTITNAKIKITPEDGLTVVSINDLITDEIMLASDIKPGASGNVNIKIRATNALPDIFKTYENIQFKIRATITGKLDGNENITITSPAFGVKIASQLGLAALARYWSESGDQLGRGPIPPVVGSATRYWVFWSVKNTTGAANGVRVTAQLPMNVGYTGKASVPFGDAPIFDPSTRTLTWVIGDVPTWPGVTSAAIGAGFELSLIPTPDQVGTYPQLILNQKISGTDNATGLTLNNSASDLNSKLTQDPKAAGLGPVK